jgi:hypothetical protein
MAKQKKPAKMGENEWTAKRLSYLVLALSEQYVFLNNAVLSVESGFKIVHKNNIQSTQWFCKIELTEKISSYYSSNNLYGFGKSATEAFLGLKQDLQQSYIYNTNAPAT